VPFSVHIADGNSHLCDLYQRFFLRHGWQVETSGGGLDCLARLRRGSPAVLILDGQLLWGGADGLLAVMRDDPDLARVPVIVTSSESAPQALSGGMHPPVVRVIQKPFSLAALLEVARSELETNPAEWKSEDRQQNSPHVCS
jgi:DNA-binding NtrC family response regulator